jgi:hypothetical protein
MNEILEAWEKIKKTLTPARNNHVWHEDDLDTIEWVLRNEVKVIDKFINEQKVR